MECEKNVRIDFKDEAEANVQSNDKTEVPTLSAAIDAREKVCESNSNGLPSIKGKK